MRAQKTTSILEHEPRAVIAAVDQEEGEGDEVGEDELATTPPKAMPPFHRDAARGTLPMEQTKLMMAMNGPTTGVLEKLVESRAPVTKTACHTDVGTSTARKPATV